MSPHEPLSNEGQNPPVPEAQGRGLFYYVAVFFILAGLLCFILDNASFNWWPTTPTPVTSTTAP